MAERNWALANSAFDVHSLGYNAKNGTEQFLTEEDREANVHIIGSPGEGKSKLLELLIRQDMDSGYGACLIDPSDNGDTVTKVLKYAIESGFPPEKILLIDPHDFYRYNAIPVINPLHIKYDAAKRPDLRFAGAAIPHVQDAVEILWSSDFSAMTRVKEFLPALFKALYAADLSLAELALFRQADSDNFREHILSCLPENDTDRKILASAFRSESAFQTFKPTAVRLRAFTDERIMLMLGSKVQTVDFAKIIRDGYLVLLNLDPTGVFDQDHQRLIGTLVINELIAMILDLRDPYRNRPWDGVYYLYIDEVGQYATQKLADLVDYRRKSKMRVTIAHQGFSQIIPKILESLFRSTKIKIMFHTADQDDRTKMIKHMTVPGELTPEDIMAISNLRKRHAFVKNNKRQALEIEIQSVEDITTVDSDDLDAYKQQIYNSSPWYRSPANIQAEINARFTTRTKPDGGGLVNSAHNVSGSAGARTPDDSTTTSQAQAERPEGPITRSIFGQEDP